MVSSLYYGTDARFLTMQPDTRLLYNSICIQIIKELYRQFLPYYTPTSNSFKELFKNHCLPCNEKFLKELSDSMFQGRLLSMFKKEESYSFHSARIFACSDAKNSYAGGKYGKAAHILIKAAELLNWMDLDKNIVQGVNLIKMIAEGEPQPVILVINNYNKDLQDKVNSEDNCNFTINLTSEDFHNLFKSQSTSFKIEKVSLGVEEELNKKENRIPCLFHGTDARVIRMTESERVHFFGNCKVVIDYLWKFYRPLFLCSDGQTRKIEEYKDLFVIQNKQYVYDNLLEKLWMVDMWKNGNQQYQYGDLYLTSSRIKAENYARRSFAGGELGLIAYRMISALEVLSFDNLYSDQNISSVIQMIKSFAEDEVAKSPVVVKAYNLEPKCLLTDEGKIIDWESSDSHIFQDYRYTQKVKLDLKYADYLR